MCTLEHELEQRIFVHKSSIVLASLLTFYNDQRNTGINIPEFLNETIEEQAKIHYYKLLANKDEFNRIYEMCWEKYGHILP